MSEYIQFAVAMILFIGILLGSYFFVIIALSRGEHERQARREREAD